MSLNVLSSLPSLAASRAQTGRTYALVVDDLNNGGDSASIWAAAEVNDSANLDLSPGWCYDG